MRRAPLHAPNAGVGRMGAVAGMQARGRAGNVEVVLDEMEATRRALDRSRSGDLVVLCVDYATDVWKELERRKSLAQPRIMLGGDGNGQVEATGGDPDLIQLDVGP